MQIGSETILHWHIYKQTKLFKQTCVFFFVEDTRGFFRTRSKDVWLFTIFLSHFLCPTKFTCRRFHTSTPHQPNLTITYIVLSCRDSWLGAASLPNAKRFRKNKYLVYWNFHFILDGIMWLPVLHDGPCCGNAHAHTTWQDSCRSFIGNGWTIQESRREFFFFLAKDKDYGLWTLDYKGFWFQHTVKCQPKAFVSVVCSVEM